MKKDGNNSTPPAIVIGPCLLLAVSLCSSAGTTFDILTSNKDVPPFLAAFWRLFLQNIVQFLPFCLSLRDVWRQDEERKIQQQWDAVHGGLSLMVEFNGSQEEHELVLGEKVKLNLLNNAKGKNNDDDDDDDDDDNGESEDRDGGELIIPKYINSFPLLLASGIALGIHFSMWVYSLRYTSLTHSLLFVSVSPVVLNVGSWILFGASLVFAKSALTFKRPSLFESIGAALGVVGAAVMLLDTKTHDALIITNEQQQQQEHQHGHAPSVYGDMAAFIGAVAICIYLLIGKAVRSWLPIWLYVFPVIGFASITCLIFALLDSGDPSTWMGMTNASVFGLFSKKYFLYALYLGIGPGIFGHTMINTLLKYVSPLIISTSLLSEPVIGSIIGHIFGMQAMPAMYTCIGGLILLVGLVLVIVGESSITNNNDINGDDEYDECADQIKKASINNDNGDIDIIVQNGKLSMSYGSIPSPG